MKITGRTGKKFLVEVDLVEIALLMGFSGLYDDKWRSMLEKQGIEQSYGEPRTQQKLEGMEIDIQRMASKIYAMREHEKKAQTSVKTLRDLAESIEMAWPELTAPIKEATA